jgi:hypothetical protein
MAQLAHADLRAPKPKASVTTLEAVDDTAANQIVFTAWVDGESGGPTPTGTITFTDGETVIAEVVVDGTMTTAEQPASVTATYNGDSKYLPSTSATLNPPYVARRRG